MPAANTDPTAPLLRARAVSKSFMGVAALQSVDFELRSGEIHALMGENGAGKSTLIKVLTGFYAADSGSLELASQPLKPRSPGEAQSLGLSTVYQEVNLIPQLSVAENIYLGREPRVGPFIRWRTLKHLAEKAIARLGLTDLDVSRPLRSYSIAIQQMVAIARALDFPNTRVLILDEPTSSLDAGEVERLFGVLKQLRAQGLGILWVTHFLDQVYAISDRITVLRNGKWVGTFTTAELPRLKLIEKMMGQDLAALKEESQAQKGEGPPRHDAVPLVRLKKVSTHHLLDEIDLDIPAGQITSLAGLLGAGRTEVARLLFGLDPVQRGEIEIEGKVTPIRSPREAMAWGLALLPEDRKAQALLPDLSVRENIVLALQVRRGWWRYLSLSAQKKLALEFIKLLNIATSGPEQAVKTLSGGNQQKVILARWLAAEPRVFILDEPTRGIDVGAKAEIQRLMLKLCQEGKALLFISSELEEVVRCSDRVAVLRDRLKVGELEKPNITEAAILRLIAADGTKDGTRA